MKITRILLIHSSHYNDQGQVVRSSSLFDRLTITNVAPLALPLLAAYVPAAVDVEIVEDCFEEIDVNDPAEVVGISAQVMQIDRARDLAKMFKSRGKIVVMGGYLPTMHPELVQDFVDSLCIGDGEHAWPQMLEDIEKGVLQKRYYGSSEESLHGIKVPRYDLIKKDRFVLYPIFATRGCPFTCDYCSIIQFHKKNYRLRPVEEVIRDIKATKTRWIYFCDDGLMENVKYSKELFRAMKDLHVVWGTQTTINCANDPELLALAYQAGCRFVALGMESLSQKNLQAMNKTINRIDQFSKQIETIHKFKIAAHVLIIFGLDEDTPQTYEETFNYLMKLNVLVAEFFLCTPYPATPFGKRMLANNRMLTTDLAKYREGYLTFKHPTMSEDEIITNYWHTLRRFYSLFNIAIRFFKGSYKNRFYHLANALSYWVKIKRNIIPVYFGQGNRPVAPKSFDPVGIWTSVLGNFGEFTEIFFAKDNQTVWMSHEKYDGVGAFAKLLRESGLRVGVLFDISAKLQRPLTIFQKSWAIFLYLKDSFPRKTFWKKEQLEVVGKKLSPAMLAFSLEETLQIKQQAKQKGVSLNSWLLFHLDQIVSQELLAKNQEKWWLIPCNMRPYVVKVPDTGNHASYVVAKIAAKDGPKEIHQKVKKMLSNNYHWGAWYVFQISRWIKIIGMKMIFSNYYRNNHSWVGTLSNLGAWPPDGNQ